MARRSDYKRFDDLAAWDLDKGCRRIVDQSTPSRRRLKKRLKRQGRKRLNKDGEYSADEQPTVDAIPVDWLERRLNETAEATARGDDQTELNNAIFQVLVEWEKGRLNNGKA